jgi:hypothetical protein
MSATLEILSPNDPEYQYVDTKMHETIRTHSIGNIGRYDIVKIERIDNRDAWRRYSRTLQQLTGTERRLFYATERVEDVLEHGLVMDYASRPGMFGRGMNLFL